VFEENLPEKVAYRDLNSSDTTSEKKEPQKVTSENITVYNSRN